LGNSYLSKFFSKKFNEKQNFAFINVDRNKILTKNKKRTKDFGTILVQKYHKKSVNKNLLVSDILLFELSTWSIPDVLCSIECLLLVGEHPKDRTAPVRGRSSAS
jgi:hypothetical protein